VSARRIRRDAERVRHIREAAAKLAEIVADGREAFDADWRQRLAAERLLITLGEAGRNLSEEFAATRPALQVHRARGMRNFLVHEYDDVDPQRVWDAIIRSVPEFVEALCAQPNRPTSPHQPESVDSD